MVTNDDTRQAEGEHRLIWVQTYSKGQILTYLQRANTQTSPKSPKSQGTAFIQGP